MYYLTKQHWKRSRDKISSRMQKRVKRERWEEEIERKISEKDCEGN